MPDDELIDRAAHELTRGEPSPQLRHAVRARIDAGRPGLEFGGPVLAKQARRIWIPVAAAAAIVLSVSVARTLWLPRAEPDGTRATIGQSHAPMSEPAASTPPKSPPSQLARIERPERGRFRRRTEQPERPNELNGSNGSNGSNNSDATIDPIVIPPLELPQLAVGSSSGVMPIEIDPLQIEPLHAE